MEFNTLCLILSIAADVLCADFFAAGIMYRKKVAEKQIGSAEEEAKRIINEAIKGGESKKREMLLEAKEEIHKSRSEYEQEVKERRAEVSKQERRLQQKEEALDKKVNLHEKKEDELAKKIAAIDKKQEEVDSLKRSQMEVLEKISGLTQDEAKAYILKDVEDDVRHETAMKIKEIETQMKEEADQTAREIIATAIQRCAADHAAETTVSVVPLPNDEMKGLADAGEVFAQQELVDHGGFSDVGLARERDLRQAVLRAVGDGGDGADKFRVMQIHAGLLTAGCRACGASWVRGSALRARREPRSPPPGRLRAAARPPERGRRWKR